MANQMIIRMFTTLTLMIQTLMILYNGGLSVPFGK